MNHDANRLDALLSGYATGNLTEQEREELFTAALADQSLFDKLMREEALREMVEQPGVKARLLEAVAPAPPSLGARLAAWWRRPVAWGVTGAAVAAAAVVIMVTVPRESVMEQQERQIVASSKEVADKSPVVGAPVPASPPPVERFEPQAMRQPSPVRPRQQQNETAASAPATAPQPVMEPRVASTAADMAESRQTAAAPAAAPAAPMVAELRKEEAEKALPGAAADAAAAPLSATVERPQAMAKSVSNAVSGPVASVRPPLQAQLQVRSASGAFVATTGIEGAAATVRVAVTAAEDGFVRAELRRGQGLQTASAITLPVKAGQTVLVPSPEGLPANEGDLLSLRFASDAARLRTFGGGTPGGQGFRAARVAPGVPAAIEIPIRRLP